MRPRPAPAAAPLAAIAGCLLAVTACAPSSPEEPASTLTATPTASAAPTTEAPPPTPSAAPSTTDASPVPAVSGRLTTVGPPALVAGGLVVPWGVALLPDGSALVAERRSGRILLVGAGAAARTIGTVPGVRDAGEGGLLGLAVPPAGDRVLAYLTSVSGDNRVVSMPFDGRRLGSPTVLLSDIPAGRIHNGGRLALGPDGRLWIGTGDAGVPSRAPDRRSLGGKVLRIDLDGGVPDDNPFPGSPVWSTGHRNVQGLAFDSRGRLWATEFGQKRFDELNLVRRGGDHGWPAVEGRGGDSRYVDPVVVWSTDEASPSGLAIVDDVAYVGALRGERLWMVPLRERSAARPVAALEGRLGRIRTVVAAADGSLWLTTSNRDGRGDPRPGDDRVVRVVLG